MGKLLLYFNTFLNRTLQLNDLKTNTLLLQVTYEPSDEGPHEISVTLDGKQVPRSPVNLDVLPGVDLNKIKLNDFENEVFVDCTNEFEVKMNTYIFKDKNMNSLQCNL